MQLLGLRYSQPWFPLERTILGLYFSTGQFHPRIAPPLSNAGEGSHLTVVLFPKPNDSLITSWRPISIASYLFPDSLNHLSIPGSLNDTALCVPSCQDNPPRIHNLTVPEVCLLIETKPNPIGCSNIELILNGSCLDQCVPMRAPRVRECCWND